MQRLWEKTEIEPGDAAATGEDQDQTWSYGRRLRLNMEIQRLREKIKIEPGDAAATGEDEEEGYGKRQRQAEKMERRR
ncbi:hypothetical protein C1H46_019329 [Malus baccata]|uniref:Uncharacterized protein n=1 Tax=Malus baccata TaxID=106549 RepID=A0A540M8K1_MALBA|nr:hypothetical protein C1H46_019329 [Malus baccata]